MITIGMLMALENNDGLTLKNYNSICYKSGWQVATEGIETKSAAEAYRAIFVYGGTCGIWKFENTYYIDRSKRVSTKKQALEIGRACNQISILRWRDMGLVFC